MKAIALTILATLAQTAAAQTSNARPGVLAFTDTSSVRLEVAVNPGAVIGDTVRAQIRGTKDSVLLWKGALGIVPNDRSTLTATVRVPNAKRWSPQSPNLYYLTVYQPILVPGTHGDHDVAERVRIGFRTMTASKGQLVLNGKPVFLRGNAINPPERNVPDSLDENRRFVEPYIRYLKSVGVNIIRLTRHSQVWFDVADEQGMMLFQGNYGTPQGGKSNAAPKQPFSESLRWYKDDVIGPLVNHPSVVIYVLSNEQADREIHYLSQGADEIDRFLKQAYDSLHAWDPTRAYIANAGYGFGRAGDICDLHRYWGWYYNSFLSFYTMRDPKVCWRTPVQQPMTMTENTGNYTGVDGRFNLVSNTKQPDSQLNWTGHAPESEQASRALSYQAWMAGQAIEIFRRSREQNPNLAGLTPFTILFHNWYGIGSFADMKPKPIGAQYGVSYQPVLLSWENWTPQVYAGSTIRPVAHVVNDGDAATGLTGLSVRWAVTDSAGVQRLAGQSALPDVPYYAARSRPLAIQLPRELRTGRYTLAGVLVRGTDTLSRNTTPLFIAAPDYAGQVTAGGTARRVVLHDPAGASRAALARLGVKAVPFSAARRLVPSSDLLVIGAESWSPAIARDTAALARFITAGGRVIVLHQDPARFDGRWLPAPIRLQTSELDHSKVFPGGRPFRNGMAVNPERPEHPALAGIDRDRLFLWSDFTEWNESKPGFPQVYPVTRGFVLTDPSKLDRVAVLANYDHGLEGIALAELFEGTGSAIVTGFDVVDRAGRDPVSDKMLANLVRYMASPGDHDASQLVSHKITWGDYASEHGIVTGIYNGLLVNTVPIVPAELQKKYPVSVDAEGFVQAGGNGGWNTKPAIQYVARGRRPFGPYTFTSGGSVTTGKNPSAGEGRVWIRIPEGRTTMITTIQNPIDTPLELDLTLDGRTQRVRVAGNATTTVETPVTSSTAPHAIAFKGDRRLVILTTETR